MARRTVWTRRPRDYQFTRHRALGNGSFESCAESFGTCCGWTWLYAGTRLGRGHDQRGHRGGATPYKDGFNVRYACRPDETCIVSPGLSRRNHNFSSQLALNSHRADVSGHAFWSTVKVERFPK